MFSVSPLPWGSSGALCPTSDSTHHVLGVGLLFCFGFVINLSVPQYPIWDKKKQGDEPSSRKQFATSACSVVLCFPGYLHIWPSLLLFPLSSCTGKVEVMLESLLGSRAFFPSKKPQTGKLAAFVLLTVLPLNYRGPWGWCPTSLLCAWHRGGSQGGLASLLNDSLIN